MGSEGVTIERFDVAEQPDAGRPEVVRFRSKQGTLHIHVSREDGALWAFASGPAGGARGAFVVPVERSAEFAVWLDEPLAAAFYGNTVRFGLREVPDADYTVLYFHGRGRWGHWAMRLTPPAREELTTCLREWAQAARAKLAEVEYVVNLQVRARWDGLGDAPPRDDVANAIVSGAASIGLRTSEGNLRVTGAELVVDG